MVCLNRCFRPAALLMASCLAFPAGVTLAAPAAQQVAEHLAVGEFGLAAEVAQQVTDPEQQSQLLKQVASAQQNQGQSGAARGTLSRMSRAGDRAQTLGQTAQQQALNGGGAQVDFQSLIYLIQQNTSGEWAEDTGGEGGSATPFYTGVRAAPARVLGRASVQDQSGRLNNVAQNARQASLNEDMSQTSPLRMVSLRKLEAQVAASLHQGLPVPESMARLAGLTRVELLIVDAEHHDILIGGPAEGWQFRAMAEPVGVKSGRPTLQLDDLVTVMRAFGKSGQDFGCSINTRDEGVKALQEYAAQSQARGALDSRSVRSWVNQLQRKLGQQDIVVWGVPADSRVAKVIVEADYRMKLIGIDKLDAGKAIPSYFDLLASSNSKEAPPMEALRWWLTMKYDAVAHSPDRSVFEIQGSAVLCQSENQMLTAEGKHLPTGKSEQTNRQFAENFTTHYSELAARDTVFADMQNVFDLALIAALVRQENLTQKTGWNPGVFAASGAYHPAQHVVPREIESVVNHKVYRGRDIVVQVAGGVQADMVAVASNAELSKESAELQSRGKNALTSTAPAGRWWWDAPQK